MSEVFEDGQMTVREAMMNESGSQPQKLIMSGRRPAKSVDRTARGAPIHTSQEAESTPHNHYEEYGMRNNNQHFLHGPGHAHQS